MKILVVTVVPAGKGFPTSHCSVRLLEGVGGEQRTETCGWMGRDQFTNGFLVWFPPLILRLFYCATTSIFFMTSKCNTCPFNSVER